MPENSEEPLPQTNINVNIAGDLSGNLNAAGRDIITVGDMNASVAAIGAGAKVIYNNVERALSQVEMADKALELEQQRLAEAVKAYVARLQKQAEQGKQTIIAGNTPYKALLSYDIEDAALFYGRSKAIAELLGKIGRDELTILHADSGAGKSSLVKAGIMSRLLAAGAVPLYIRPYQTTVPYAIKRALLPQLEQTPSLAVASLHDFLRFVTDRLGGTEVIIILDQFEEFFILQSPEQRREFIDELGPCLDDDLLPVRWVFALRKEWFGDLGVFRPQVKDPFANEYMLKALTAEEAREIIVEPALRFNVRYEDKLVDALIEDLGQKEIAPPQLQIVCSALFDALEGYDEVSMQLYYSLGGTSGILRTHLDRVIKRNVPTGQRQAARLLLEALVTSDRRRAVRTRDELIAELRVLKVEQATLDELLQILVDSRLLVSEEIEKEDVDLVAYELAHDYLVSNIELDPAAQSRKSAQELLDREVESYRRLKTILGPDKLAIIEAHKDELNIPEDGARLLEASEKRLARERVTYLAGAGVVVGLVILAIVSVSTAIGAQRLRTSALDQLATAQAASNTAATQQAASEQSRLAGTSRLLALSAQTSLNNGDVLRAARFAIQAYQTSPTIESRAALFSVSQEEFPTAIYPATDEFPLLQRFSSDSSRVVVASNSTSFYVAEVPSGTLVAQVSLPGTLASIETDAALDHFAVLTFTPTNNSGQIDVWGLVGQEPVYSFVVPSGDFIQNFALSPDGNTLGIVLGSGRVMMVDLPSRAEFELKASVVEGETEPDDFYFLFDVIFDSQGQFLSAYNGSIIVSYDVATHAEVGSLIINHSISNFTAVPGTTSVLVGLATNEVALIDLAGPVEVSRVAVSSDPSFSPIIVSPSNDSFAIFDGSTFAYERYDIASGQSVNFIFTTGDLLAGGILPDNNRLIALSRYQPNRLFLTVEPSTDQGTAGSALIPVGTTGSVLATFSPDGNFVLITGENRTPLLWDVGQLFPAGAALLPETTFASVFPSQTASENLVTTFDGKLTWFDLAAEPVSVKGAREDVGFGEPLFTAGFTANGPIYVTADLVQPVPPLSVFTFDSEQPVTTIRPSAPVLLATISQDGTLLAGYDTDRALTIWSATTGEVVSTLPPAVDILSLVFSPDGTSLATGASNGRWTIFSVETGAEIATGRHRRSVNSVDFNTDGSRLATASDDGTVKIWEPSNGTELASFDIGAKALRVAYSPDSTLLLVQNASSEWSIISAGDGTPLADLGQFTYLSVQLTPDNNHALALSYPADFYKLSLAPNGLAEQLKSKLEALGLPVGP